MSDTVTLTAPRLTDIAASLLQAGGFTASEAGRTSQSLVLSNLMGYDSHGVMRVAQYINELRKGETISGAEFVILRESSSMLLADGGRGLGQVQMPEFITRMQTKAAQQGVASGALRNCGHIGRIGEWTDKIAQAGFAAHLMVNDNGCFTIVAPPGGREGRTSTNPFSFAIPLGNGHTFMIDLSTSASAMGKIRVAHLAGQQVPSGILQDAEGTPTTDPAVISATPRGSLLPMGGAEGYKGFAVSMAIDMMTAGLSGGFTPPAPAGTAGTNNVVLTIWDPSFFAGEAHMAQEAEKYLAYLRETPPTNPGKPIRLPGDQSSQEKSRREENGIPISRGTCNLLAKSAELVGIPIPPEFVS